MEFNEIMQSIMTFINENTLLLIGICVFLILVLVGYLIDNSVNSKRIRKDIKNKDQVPANIKEEIIKEAEEKGEVKKAEEVVQNISVENANNVEPVVVTPTVEPAKEEITLDLNTQSNEVNNNVELQNDALDSTLNLNTTENVEVQNEALDNALNLDSSLKVEDTNLDNLIGDAVNTNDDLILTDKQADTLDLDLGIISNDIESTVDPDAFIMGSVLNENGEYKNDKRLSEILSENITLNTLETNNSNEAPLNIEINNDVNNSSQDELDQIMQKLSSLKTDTEEDNYTNIF